MNTFVSNFLQNKIGEGISKGGGLLNLPYQRINEGLTKFKQLLASTCPRYDSLICAFTQNPELISDDFVSGGAVNVVDGAKYAELSNDVGDDLYNGVLEAITNNGMESDSTGLTLSDAKGYTYNIINQAGSDGDNPLSFQNCEIYLSQTREVSKLSEAILYKNAQGKWQLNNIIRTADFVKQDAHWIKGSTILAKMQLMCVIDKGIEPTTICDCASTLSGIPFSPIMSTINIHMAAYAQSVGADWSMLSGGLLDKLDVLEDMAIARAIAQSGKGYFSSLWSVIKDEIESASLNGAILTMIQSIQSFSAITESTFDIVLEKVGNKFNSVTQFITNAKAAWLKGSFVSLGAFILSYAQAMTKIGADDGLLSFSDNKDLVPQQYIAGMVFQIISSIVTVAGIIISIFSKIVGAIVTVIGGILSALANVITNDHDQSYAALQNDTNIFFPMAPHAIYQFTVDSDGGLPSNVKELFEQGADLVTIQVPGGYLVIGPSEVNEQNLDIDWMPWEYKYPTCIFKFYPSIVPHNKNNALQRLIENIHSEQGMFSAPAFDWSVTNQTIILNKDCVRNYLAEYDMTIDDLIEVYTDAEEDYDYSSDDTLLVKDATKDTKLRTTIIQNMAWFELWLLSRRGYLAEFPTAQTGYLGITPVEIDTESWFYPLVCAANPTTFRLAVAASDPSRISYLIADDPTWNNLGDFAVACSLAYGGHHNITSVTYHVFGGQYIDSMYETSSRMGFAIKTPEYDPDTFWAWVVVSAIVVTVVTVVTIVASVKLKKAINKRRAINQAKVESAWENLKSSPTSENYDAYRKTVRKNNLWAKFIGGTRYDYVNYWNGDTSSTQGSLTGAISSGLFDPIEDSESLISTQDPTTNNNVLDVVTLIRGNL